MGQNQVILRHQKFTFPRAREWAKGASERTSERSGGRERSEQSGASEWVSGASELANGRASGPVLTSLFLFVPDHSAAACVRYMQRYRFLFFSLSFSFSSPSDGFPFAMQYRCFIGNLLHLFLATSIISSFEGGRKSVFWRQSSSLKWKKKEKKGGTRVSFCTKRQIASDG